MSEISSYQKRFLSLYKRLTNAVAWQWFVEGLADGMLVGGGSGRLGVIDELERRCDVIYDEIVSLFGEFLEKEGRKKSKSLEDSEHERAVIRILYGGKGPLNGFREETANRVSGLAALAEEFGPVRVPFDGSLGGKILAYEQSLFWEWVSEALDAHGCPNFDPLDAKNEGSIWEAVSFLASRKKGVFIREDSFSFNLPNESPPFGPVEVPEGEWLVKVTAARCKGRSDPWSIRFFLEGEDPSELFSCGGEVEVPVEEEADFRVFDYLDFADSLDVAKLWRSGSKMVRGGIDDLPSSRASPQSKGILLSVFAGFLCLAADVEPTPSRVGRIVVDGGYRERLLERADKSRIRTAHKLKGMEWANDIAEVFWRRWGV